MGGWIWGGADQVCVLGDDPDPLAVVPLHVDRAEAVGELHRSPVSGRQPERAVLGRVGELDAVAAISPVTCEHAGQFLAAADAGLEQGVLFPGNRSGQGANAPVVTALSMR
jgi:hypothetical protein